MNVKWTLVVLSFWPLSFSVIYRYCRFSAEPLCGEGGSFPPPGIELALMKITPFDATRCQILTLKCTKFDFRWGSAPDSAGELTAPPDILAVFKGACF